MKKKSKKEQMVKLNLELVRKFLKAVIRDPRRVAHIPNDSTLILYPVVLKPSKAA